MPIHVSHVYLWQWGGRIVKMMMKMEWFDEYKCKPPGSLWPPGASSRNLAFVFSCMSVHVSAECFLVIPYHVNQRSRAQKAHKKYLLFASFVTTHDSRPIPLRLVCQRGVSHWCGLSSPSSTAGVTIYFWIVVYSFFKDLTDGGGAWKNHSGREIKV